MCSVDTYVAARSARFNQAQAEFDREKTALHATIHRAFQQLCPVKAGDRITAIVDGHRGSIDGRAVIMRDGTRMGLYVDTGHSRYPVAQPYATCVRLSPRKRKTRSLR